MRGTRGGNCFENLTALFKAKVFVEAQKRFGQVFVKLSDVDQ